MGITIIGTYYYNFIPLYSKEEIINVYTKMCLYVAIIGYPMYFLKINLNDGRLQSIFTEPAHYVIVVIPACYYFLKSKQYLFFAIIFGTLLLSQSSIGYIGCGLIFIVPNLSYKRSSYLMGLLPIVVGIFYFAYLRSPMIQIRVNDTYESFSAIGNGKFEEKTNVSSYALMSNLYIARRNILDHPFGSGIGSHFHMHTKVYLNQMRPPEYIKTLKLDKINAPDAASLFIRIISDLGVFGFILIIYLMYLAIQSYSFKDLFLAQGIIIYLLLKLFRDGHYFPPEFYFFVWILYFSLRDKMNNKEPLALKQ